MQYLVIDNNETLVSMNRAIGNQNADVVLAENGLPRNPNVGKNWLEKCEKIVEETTKLVTPSRKSALLNGLTNSEDVFEKACLMDEDEWKIFSSTLAFRDALKIPETTRLPYSTKVIGNVAGDVLSSSVGEGNPSSSSSQVGGVDSRTYRAVMNSLKTTGNIDMSVFESINSSPMITPSRSGMLQASKTMYSFNLPWGKIQMYSTVLKELMDFPVYPEQIETMRAASYTSMPDIIYQYEPWIVFQNSGPREQTLTFHMHRDMWTGNHLDGRANQLIRFCEANTFADYQGSAVITPLIRFYIDGSLFISGVLTNTTVTWTGPIGLDNWYLEFTLSMSIQEISEMELNAKSVYTKKLKEG